jgi:hypothetical protein
LYSYSEEGQNLQIKGKIVEDCNYLYVYVVKQALPLNAKPTTTACHCSSGK